MTKDEYKQLYEQVCEQYDVLAKELATIKQALAAQPEPVQGPVRWSDYEPDGRRYPAVPDAMTSADIQESIEYVAGWNDCRQAMLEMMK
jgi:hypothetical protein